MRWTFVIRNTADLFMHPPFLLFFSSAISSGDDFGAWKNLRVWDGPFPFFSSPSFIDENLFFVVLFYCHKKIEGNLNPTESPRSIGHFWQVHDCLLYPAFQPPVVRLLSCWSHACSRLLWARKTYAVTELCLKIIFVTFYTISLCAS